jgi:hypothetical protein
MTHITIQWWALVNTVMDIRVPYKCEFLEHLNDFQLLKKDSAPWTYLTLEKPVHILKQNTVTNPDPVVVVML